MLTTGRTLFFFVVFWIHQILILPLLLIFHLLHHFRGALSVRTPVCSIARGWGWLMCRLGGAKVTFTDRSGQKENETVLYVSNHQGDFDIPLLLCFGKAPLAFVAKKELAKFPLVSNWMYLLGCIFLDRDDRRKQVKQIRETVEHLKTGLSMVIFPEGTRSRGPEMKPFAKGSLNIAEKAGVRLVPVTLKDSYRLKIKGRFGLPGGKVEVIFHPAVDPADLDAEKKAVLHEVIQSEIQKGLEEGR